MILNLIIKKILNPRCIKMPISAMEQIMGTIFVPVGALSAHRIITLPFLKRDKGHMVIPLTNTLPLEKRDRKSLVICPL